MCNKCCSRNCRDGCQVGCNNCEYSCYTCEVCPAPRPCPIPPPAIPNVFAEGMGNIGRLEVITIPTTLSPTVPVPTLLTWVSSVSSSNLLTFGNTSTGQITFRENGWYELSFTGLCEISSVAGTIGSDTITFDLVADYPTAFINPLGNPITRIHNLSGDIEHFHLDFKRLVRIIIPPGTDRLRLTVLLYGVVSLTAGTFNYATLNGNYTLNIDQVKKFC